MARWQRVGTVIYDSKRGKNYLKSKGYKNRTEYNPIDIKVKHPTTTKLE
jgi:hypothetical protein